MKLKGRKTTAKNVKLQNMFHYFSDLSHRPEKIEKQTHKSTNATTCTTRTPNLMWTMQRHIIPALLKRMPHVSTTHTTRNACIFKLKNLWQITNCIWSCNLQERRMFTYSRSHPFTHSLSLSLSFPLSRFRGITKKHGLKKKTAFHRYLVYGDSYSRWCLQRFVLFYIQADYYFAE